MRALWLLLLALCMLPVAHAEIPPELLPPGLLTPEQAASALSAEAIGPPARMYDHVTKTAEAATDAERAVEALVLGKRAEELAAPDSLRRYGRLSLNVRRSGALHPIHAWFLAEHAGLALPPTVQGWFVLGPRDPATAAEQVSNLLSTALKDDELRAVAVTLVDLPDKDAWLGQVTTLEGAARFEPFPRIFAPGAVARIPGTTLEAGQSHSLYVGRMDVVETEEYPLTAKGDFDVEFPLPTSADTVRVAMSRSGRRGAPENTFFFSLYVGQDPPASFGMLDLRLPEGERSVEQEEAAFLETVNETRTHFGLGTLSRIGDGESTRELAKQAPEAPPAFHRYYKQIADMDPMPGVPHGSWSVGWCDGLGGRDAAWLCLQHPSMRAALLDSAPSGLVMGAVNRKNHGLGVLAYMVGPEVDVEEARASFRARLAEAGGIDLLPAPHLQAKLDEIAAQVAEGTLSMKRGMKQAQALGKPGGDIQGRYLVGVQVTSPDHPPQIEGYTPRADMSHAAIGLAAGTLGKEGPSYLVYVICLAGTAG